MFAKPRDGYRIVEFRKVGGVTVPTKPWPQIFYVSNHLMTEPTVVLRPLTATGLIRGVGRNFLTMSFWRFMWRLYRMGFLDTKEYEVFRFSHDFRLDFWRVLSERKH